MLILIDLIRREVCHWRFLGDRNQDSKSYCNTLYLSSERKRHTKFSIFDLSLILRGPNFIQAYAFLALVIFHFSIIAARFSKNKDKIIVAVCSWHRSSRNQREKLLAISRPVADWLRFSLPWPFLIHGRICSVVEKLPEPGLSWLQHMASGEARAPARAPSLIPPSASQTRWSESTEVGRASKLIQTCRPRTETVPSSQKPFTHTGHCVPFRSTPFSSEDVTILHSFFCSWFLSRPLSSCVYSD